MGPKDLADAKGLAAANRSHLRRPLASARFFAALRMTIVLMVGNRIASS